MRYTYVYIYICSHLPLTEDFLLFYCCWSSRASVFCLVCSRCFCFFAFSIFFFGGFLEVFLLLLRSRYGFCSYEWHLATPHTHSSALGRLALSESPVVSWRSGKKPSSNGFIFSIVVHILCK